MSVIELFAFPYFKGKPFYITEDTADLKSEDLLQNVKSLKVTGEPWIVFSEVEYKGFYKCFIEGEYPTLPQFQHHISSVRCVKGGLDNPKITLHEHVLYGGDPKIQEKSVYSLPSENFPIVPLSHKVTSGAWVLCTEENYHGHHMVTVAGDEVAVYSAFTGNDKVKSLRPLQA